jgi:hypothetical protein
MIQPPSLLRPDRQRVRIRHPRAIAGHASSAWTGHHRERLRAASQSSASGRRPGGNGIAENALGRHHRARMRRSSRPSAHERNALGRHHRERPRTPTWLAGQRVPPAWCRPTSACSPTPLRVERDRADYSCYHGVKTFPTYRGGAADAPGVGRA